MMNDVVVCLFSFLLLGLGYVNVRGKVSTGPCLVFWSQFSALVN